MSAVSVFSLSNLRKSDAEGGKRGKRVQARFTKDSRKRAHVGRQYVDMPFRLGKDPIRFTLQYLERGPLVFKERVRVMLVHFNQRDKTHAGVKNFLHWYTPQIQYKNSNVQIVSMKDMMPTPFIRLFLDNNEEVIVDAEGKSKEGILSHLIHIMGKSESVLAAEQKEAHIVENVSNFGDGCGRYCICEVPGQVPCPGVVPLPKAWRGKYKYGEVDE